MKVYCYDIFEQMYEVPEDYTHDPENQELFVKYSDHKQAMEELGEYWSNILTEQQQRGEL